jgi:hypothetical protein
VPPGSVVSVPAATVDARPTTVAAASTKAADERAFM